MWRRFWNRVLRALRALRNIPHAGRTDWRARTQRRIPTYGRKIHTISLTLALSPTETGLSIENQSNASVTPWFSCIVSYI